MVTQGHRQCYCLIRYNAYNLLFIFHANMRLSLLLSRYSESFVKSRISLWTPGVCHIRLGTTSEFHHDLRQQKTRNRKHRRAAAKPAACAPNAVNTREQGKEGGRVR